MERTMIQHLPETKKQKVLLKGWIYKIKNFSNFSFVDLRDKTGLVQLVIDSKKMKELKLEMAIEVTGKLEKNGKAPKGMEIHVESIHIIGQVYYELLPFSINQSKVQASLEKELDYRYISLRRPDRRAVFNVQEEVVEAFRGYLKGRGFSEIHTPKIIASGTEGGSEMFTVNYFDTRAFLAQSPQFYKQMMVGAGFESVFEIGHAYRAEPHSTYRHLNEYVSLDIEMGFIDDENELMDLEEDFINYLFRHLNQTCTDELKLLKVELKEVNQIPRIPLKEAQEILDNEYGKNSPMGNLDAEGEILFSQYVKEKYNNDFVFLTKYPVSKRPMYAMPDNEPEGTTKSFDLIYKGLEITTGGLRIHDYERLKENIIRFGANSEDFSFYLDSFKYGMPPHGGFAIGLERITMKLLDLENIRQSTLLPRDIRRIEP